MCNVNCLVDTWLSEWFIVKFLKEKMPLHWQWMIRAGSPKGEVSSRVEKIHLKYRETFYFNFRLYNEVTHYRVEKPWKGTWDPPRPLDETAIWLGAVLPFCVLGSWLRPVLGSHWVYFYHLQTKDKITLNQWPWSPHSSQRWIHWNNGILFLKKEEISHF